MSCKIKTTIDQRPIQVKIEGVIVNVTQTDTQTLIIKARKASAGTITKGQVVYIVGSTGNHLTVELARANVEATSAYTIGIASTNITNTADGFIMQYGRLSGLSTVPTTNFSDGDAIYLSETTAGGYRLGLPQAPNHGVLLGFVIRANNGNAGEIDVRIQNYQELEELSDVYVNNQAGNDFLMRNSGNTRWENITLANVQTILGINKAGSTTTNSNTPTINNTRGYFTTNTLTTIAGNAGTTITVTNSTVTTNSIIKITQGVYSGTIGANGVPYALMGTISNGSFTIIIRNVHGTNALNGTLRLMFEVLTL